MTFFFFHQGNLHFLGVLELRSSTPKFSKWAVWYSWYPKHFPAGSPTWAEIKDLWESSASCHLLLTGMLHTCPFKAYFLNYYLFASIASHEQHEAEDQVQLQNPLGVLSHRGLLTCISFMAQSMKILYKKWINNNHHKGILNST